jgi:hypothetical protein
VPVMLSNSVATYSNETSRTTIHHFQPASFWRPCGIIGTLHIHTTPAECRGTLLAVSTLHYLYIANDKRKL